MQWGTSNALETIGRDSWTQDEVITSKTEAARVCRSAAPHASTIGFGFGYRMMLWQQSKECQSDDRRRRRRRRAPIPVSMTFSQLRATSIDNPKGSNNSSDYYSCAVVPRNASSAPQSESLEKESSALCHARTANRLVLSVESVCNCIGSEMCSEGHIFLPEVS